MDKLKPYYPLFLLVAAFIGIYFFYDYLTEILLGTIGLGAAAAASQKSKQEKALAVADEHEALMDGAIADAVIQQKHADMLRQDALDIAEDITPMPAEPAPGKVRRRFTSR